MVTLGLGTGHDPEPVLFAFKHNALSSGRFLRGFPAKIPFAFLATYAATTQPYRSVQITKFSSPTGSEKLGHASNATGRCKRPLAIPKPFKRTC